MNSSFNGIKSFDDIIVCVWCRQKYETVALMLKDISSHISSIYLLRNSKFSMGMAKQKLKERTHRNYKV